MRTPLIFLPLMLLAPILPGCGEAIKDDHFANTIQQDAPAAAQLAPEAVPVRIGELGPSFAACNGAGTTRHLAAGAALPVRAAPFDTAAQSGAVAAGARFFVCTRSHDQRWLGIVYDPSGALEPRCGVSSPAPRRANYAGPCRSGWIAAAFVKLVAA
jgi:hypothetical protein